MYKYSDAKNNIYFIYSDTANAKFLQKKLKQQQNGRDLSF